ncbi:MAG: hypothetical protein ABI867_24310 [Kofleriaceae bacterium]
MKRAAILVALAACDDRLDQRLSIIDAPRVLAVIAEPAEAKPKAAVTYSALVGSPDGTLAAIPQWSYCTAPKPPTEDNAVSDGCVRGGELLDLGAAATVTAPIPDAACLNFGPETPPGEFRPRDADGTGGYYQPVRADVEGLVAFGLARITCKLANAPGDVARDYDLRYVANANPLLDPIALPASVPADSDVELVATWPAASAESYLFFDRLGQRLVERREALRLSWFATAGALAVDASAVAEDDPATTTSTVWHTPGPGTATVWFTLRDSRGGIATREFQVVVE